MAKPLSPFTRITLLISELNGSRIEDLADVRKCDLAHHTARLSEDLADPAQKESADQIGAQGRLLLASLKAGETAKAETERTALVLSCKKLKDVL